MLWAFVLNVDLESYTNLASRQNAGRQGITFARRRLFLGDLQGRTRLWTRFAPALLNKGKHWRFFLECRSANADTAHGRRPQPGSTYPHLVENIDLFSIVAGTRQTPRTARYRQKPRNTYRFSHIDGFRCIAHSLEPPLPK